MQCPYYVHKALVHAFGLPGERVRVRRRRWAAASAARRTSRARIALHAALLARAAGRPVRLVYDRHEDIVGTSKRHPAVVRHRTGVDGDGRLLALDIEILIDGGAYRRCRRWSSRAPCSTPSAPTAADAVRIRGRVLRTHTAAQQRLPRLRRAAGRSSPSSARWTASAARSGSIPTRSARATWSSRATGCPPGRCSTPPPRPASAWRGGAARPASARAGGSSRRRGAGRGDGEPRRGHRPGALLPRRRLHRQRRAADALAGHRAAARRRPDRGRDGDDRHGPGVRGGLPADRRGRGRSRHSRTSIFAEPDTGDVPDSGPTVASRTTMIVGGVIARAVTAMRDRVLAGAGRAVRRRLDRASAAATRALPRRGAAAPRRGRSGRGHRAPRAAGVADVRRVHLPRRRLPDLCLGRRRGRGGGRSRHPGGASAPVTAVCEVGRAIHPTLCAGQIEGGTLQAVGWALLEEIKLKDGRYLNDRLATYIIPTIRDSPRIDVHLLESAWEGGPFGAKGVGELPMDGGAPAVAAGDRERHRHRRPGECRRRRSGCLAAACDAGGEAA